MSKISKNTDSYYVIRVYSVGSYEPPYVNYGNDSSECMPIVTELAETKEELLEHWDKLIKNYEGYGYTVYNTKTSNCIVGGVFDPTDIDILMGI